MEQLDVLFTPANGDPPRTVTIRIGTPVRGETSWTTRVEILGFDKTRAWTWGGTDWAQALELSAKAVPVALEAMVHMAGGGTLEPPFYEREPRPPTNLKLRETRKARSPKTRARKAQASRPGGKTAGKLPKKST